MRRTRRRDHEAIERKIAVRAARRERLTADEPPDCWAVLNEAVIRRVVGGTEVMLAQLQHIAALAEQPHISVQVLPFKAGARQVICSRELTAGCSLFSS